MLSPVCLSVCLSDTRVDQSKTVEVRIMQFLPYGSRIPLVFMGRVSSRNSDGFPLSGGVKQGRGRKTSHFSSFKRQYLENGKRYVHSYYWWLIGSCICAFDWHQDPWPWMTLNCNKFEHGGISRDFPDFWRKDGSYTNENRSVLSATEL